MLKTVRKLGYKVTLYTIFIHAYCMYNPQYIRCVYQYIYYSKVFINKCFNNDVCRYSEDLKVAHSQQLEEMQRRHASELREQRERMELEKQAWEENILKRQDTTMMTREREMREQLRQERDKVKTTLS